MDLTITLARTDLLNSLNEKYKELEKEYDTKIAELEKEIEEFPNTAKLIGEWHLNIATMLQAGVIKPTARGEFVAVEDVEVPARPSSSTRSSTKKDLTASIEALKRNKTGSLRELTATIKLLTIANNEVINIPASEYEKILGTCSTDYMYAYGYR